MYENYVYSESFMIVTKLPARLLYMVPYAQAFSNRVSDHKKNITNL